MSKEEKKKKSKGRRVFSIFWKICLVVLILMVAAAAVAVAKLDSILKFSIEKAGTFVTQTPVTVGKVQLKPLEGKLIIENLAVANPPGYDIPNAMVLQEAFVFLDVKSLLTPEIRVREVRLNGAEVSYVARGLTTNNITDIYQNIQRLIPESSSDKPQKEEAPKVETADSGKGKRVVIDEVNITNTKFAFGMKMLGASSLDLTISDVHLKDLGKDKDMSTTEAIAQIFDEFFKGVNSVVNVAGKVVNDTKDALKETTRALKDLFKDLKKSKKQSDTKVAPAEAEITVQPEQTEDNRQ